MRNEISLEPEDKASLELICMMLNVFSIEDKICHGFSMNGISSQG